MSYFNTVFSYISFQGLTDLEMVSGETYFEYSFPFFGDPVKYKFKKAKEYDNRFGLVKEVTEKVPLIDPNETTQVTKMEIKFDEKTGYMLENRLESDDSMTETIYSY